MPRARTWSGRIVPPDAPASARPPLPIDTEAALTAAISALAELDPDAVSRLIESGGRPALRRRPAGFEGLAQIVVGQQLSTASAGAIFARLLLAVTPFEPAVMAALSDDDLRACGLSIQKVRTLRAITAALSSGSLPLDRLAGMKADDAMTCLLAVNGIGPWTAEVFLLFCLGHADAWPAGDLALQEATRLLLGLTVRPDTTAMRIIGERWRPWRGAAAYLLWSAYRAIKKREGLIVPQVPA